MRCESKRSSTNLMRRLTRRLANRSAKVEDSTARCDSPNAAKDFLSLKLGQLDHEVVAGGRVVSFAERGLL